MIDRGLSVLPQPPAQTCCSALMTLFMQIGTSQIGNWLYSFQSAVEVQWKLLTLWDIRRYAQDGFLKVSRPSRCQRKAICSELLECFDAEGEAFLSRIVTGAENWAHHYEPEMKRQSLEWHHTQSPRKKKFKTTPSAGKLMFTVFWDMDGVIPVAVTEVRQSIRTHISKLSKN
jgi:hypothetical protein